MALRKAFCGLSLRRGTLILLYILLIENVWSLLSDLTNFPADPIMKEFLKENTNIFNVDLTLMLIGSMIFLATIVSMTNKTPSITLITSCIAFLILEAIFNLYITMHFVRRGSVEVLYVSLVESRLQEIPEKEQEEERNHLMLYQNMAVFVVCFHSVFYLAFSLYSAVIFYSYNVELKNRKRRRGNIIEDGNELSLSPPAYHELYTISPPAEPLLHSLPSNV